MTKGTDRIRYLQNVSTLLSDFNRLGILTFDSHSKYLDQLVFDQNMGIDVRKLAVQEKLLWAYRFVHDQLLDNRGRVMTAQTQGFIFAWDSGSGTQTLRNIFSSKSVTEIRAEILGWKNSPDPAKKAIAQYAQSGRNPFDNEYPLF